MRVLNDEKYNAILQAARSEFIRKGFKDASMRDIAKDANVGLSNIYNYFKNKDEIFEEVVKPAKNDLYTFIREHHSEENIVINKISAFSYQQEMIELYIDLIDKYREEFKLLLFHSDGSSLKGFRNSLTDYLTQVSIEHMSMIKKHYPETKEMSVFFIHALSSWMVSIVGEIVTHNISKHKIREFFDELFRFEIAGWRELIAV